MKDMAVIGAGPAGLSAAITARARNKDVIVVSNRPHESALAKASIIDNYPGMPKISGTDMLEQMYEQALELGVEFCFERVITVLSMGEYFSVSAGKEIINARSVVLAIGVQSSKPIAGEAEYLGRGVSYCATCDGMLYRNATVCVVGLNSEAVEEANFLAEIGASVVFLARTAPEGLAAGITVKEGTAAEIKGDALGVTELVFKSKKTRETESIACNGVFILRPAIAPDALMAGLKLNEGYIAVDEDMQTNIPGVFAAGDCTGKPLQIAKAVGDGQKACFAAVAYLG